MTKKTVLAAPDGKSISVIVADTFLKRFMGLMGRRESDYGLVLVPCNAIHTCFMRYDLDAVFLDGDNRVLEIKCGIRPWRTTRVVKNARSVLEFPSSLKLATLFALGTKLDCHF